MKKNVRQHLEARGALATLEPCEPPPQPPPPKIRKPPKSVPAVENVAPVPPVVEAPAVHVARTIAPNPDFRYNPGQQRAAVLLGGTQRHTKLVGGSRSGKTLLFVDAIFIRALKAPGSSHALFRFRANAARLSLWLDTIPMVNRLIWPDVKLIPHERDGFFEMAHNDSRLWVGGLDDKERVEKILGQEHNTLFFNECSQIPYSSVVLANTRLAKKTEGLTNRAYYDLNPTTTGHWSYKLFDLKMKVESQEKLPDPENYAYAYLNPEENAANIDQAYLESLRGLPTKQRQRFYEGRYVSDIPGQLWTLDMLARCGVSKEDLPLMQRIVVAIDPSGARNEFDIKADEIGIVVCGMGVNGHGYVLEDATGLHSPDTWARIACNLYHKWGADRIVAERNYGGAMVESVIRHADPNVAFREVTSSRGKALRAEPIAAMYERDPVMMHHCGEYPALEEEMTNFLTSGYVGSGSPNRADSLVFAMTELFGLDMTFGLLDHYRNEATEMIQTQQIMKLANNHELIKPVTSEETPKCPQCASPAIQARGGESRCAQCGCQWGGRGAVFAQSGRNEMVKAMRNF